MLKILTTEISRLETAVEDGTVVYPNRYFLKCEDKNGKPVDIETDKKTVFVVRNVLIDDE